MLTGRRFGGDRGDVLPPAAGCGLRRAPRSPRSSAASSSCRSRSGRAARRTRPRGSRSVTSCTAAAFPKRLLTFSSAIATVAVGSHRASASRSACASTRGMAAPARAASPARRPSSSASSHAMIAARTSPPPRRFSGSGGSAGTRRVASGSCVHSSSRPSRERSQDLTAEPARPDAVAGVAEPVVDARAGDRAEERQVVGRHVDRAAPGALDPRAARPGSSRRKPRSARAADAASLVKRLSTRPPKPIGPVPLPISTRPSSVVRK